MSPRVSRFTVGWMVAYRESAALGQRLIGGTLSLQGTSPGAPRPPALPKEVWINKPATTREAAH